jgi:hypothetical protein
MESLSLETRKQGGHPTIFIAILYSEWQVESQGVS